MLRMQCGSAMGSSPPKMAVPYVSERTILLSKIPPLHRDRFEMQIADIHVARPRSVGRLLAGIRCRSAMTELITTAVGQGKGGVAPADVG